MLRVGVIGEPGVIQIAVLLHSIINLGQFFGNTPDIITDGDIYEPLNVLIINEGSDASGIRMHMNSLSSNGIAIINADDKRIYRFLPKCPAGFITYGFNSKASVTASSVDMTEGDYRTIQICVQRALRDYTDAVIEQQELSIRLEESVINIHCVMAAVTSALYMGVPPFSINEAGSIRSKLSRL